jgi:ATP-dependent RNA helicase DeaD
VNGNPNFAERPLRAELKPVLLELGIVTPTPVQQACLEVGLGQDLLVQARTGSGKTLAFSLPILERMTGEKRFPQALVLAPTRELALQIAKAVSPLTRAIDARCIALTGGTELGPQIKALTSPRGAQLVVGTPGRVLDHLRRGTLSVKEVSVVVLDEGDHLLDLGFKDEIDAILEKTKDRERTLLFSATLPPEVEALARAHTKDARRIVVDARESAHADIEHQAYAVPESARAEALANLLFFEQPERTLVFCATRQGARSLSERLPLLGISAGLISGELDQEARNRALDAYREGICHVLVATDVAARGIDVPATTHVIHYNLAETPEAYTHRSGRTGRAGRKGLAISLVSTWERSRFAMLVRPSKAKIRWKDIPDPQAIARQRIEHLAELALGEVEPGPHAVEHANRIANARPLDAAFLARILQVAASLEGPPGFELAEALREDATQPRPQRGRGERPRGQPPRSKYQKPRRPH